MTTLAAVFHFHLETFAFRLHERYFLCIKNGRDFTVVTH